MYAPVPPAFPPTSNRGRTESVVVSLGSSQPAWLLLAPQLPFTLLS